MSDPRPLSRRERRALERARDDALDEALPPGQWLFRQLIPYTAVVGFLCAIQVFGDNAHMGIPIASTGIFWGMGLAMGYLRKKQASSGQTTPEQIEVPDQVEVPVKPKSPALAKLQNQALARRHDVPESVADIAELVSRVGGALRRHGQERVADRLDQGLDEVVRLAGLADAATPEVGGLRDEIARLQARADAAPDVETADLWRTNARSAEHRLEKAVALGAAADRTHARIESFRQTVKSLAVDLARLDLASEDPTMISAVGQHAESLERDVEALVRTNREIAELERPSREDAKVAAAEAEVEAAGNAGARAARSGQRTV